MAGGFLCLAMQLVQDCIAKVVRTQNLFLFLRQNLADLKYCLSRGVFLLFCLFVSGQSLVDQRKPWYSAYHHHDKAGIKLLVTGIWARFALGHWSQSVSVLLPLASSPASFAKGVFERESPLSRIQYVFSVALVSQKSRHSVQSENLTKWTIF